MKFSRGSAGELWKHGGAGEWPAAEPSERPSARITRLDTVGRVYTHAKDGEQRDPFQAFAAIEAESEADLQRVGEYIEAHFSHVEVYSVAAELP